MAQVPSGDGFTDAQMRDIERVVSAASERTGLNFSLYIGGADGDIRDAAEKLHASLGDKASRSVLVVLDPGDRLLEIVTGEESARRLSDRACALAALSMTTAFAGGALTNGIVTGMLMLAEAAGEPPPDPE
ncbi:MAG TPA: DUF5130 family protein [Mycobacteriales bacterium]|nr:DUF5130 family protein [Mycobacteriales bacterium]